MIADICPPMRVQRIKVVFSSDASKKLVPVFYVLPISLRSVHSFSVYRLYYTKRETSEHPILLHNTTQHNTTHNATQQHNTTQNTEHNTTHTTQHNTTQHNTTQHYTTLHYTTLHYTTLHYTTLHYTTLHNTTQHNTTLHYSKHEEVPVTEGMRSVHFCTTSSQARSGRMR